MKDKNTWINSLRDFSPGASRRAAWTFWALGPAGKPPSLPLLKKKLGFAFRTLL